MVKKNRVKKCPRCDGPTGDMCQTYELLVGLLKKRFPPNADGSYPDWAIEDVLLENTRLRAALQGARAVRRPRTLGEQ